MARTHKVLRALTLLVAMGFVGVLHPSPAVADSLNCTSEVQDRGYIAVEERSHEYFIEADDQGRTRVRIRSTLYNNAATPQDVVYRIAVPRFSELEGFAFSGFEGFVSGVATTIADEGQARDPGSAYARLLDPKNGNFRYPIVEIVVYKMAPQKLAQIEFTLRAQPERRVSQWELTFPSRSISGPFLQSQRRFLVRNRDGHPKSKYWVDDIENKGQPLMLAAADNVVTVSWPAAPSRGSLLQAVLEQRTDPGKNRSDFHLGVQLGQLAQWRPKSIALLYDNSQSVASDLPSLAYAFLSRILSATKITQPGGIFGFDRHIFPVRADASSIQKRIDEHPQGVGSDVVSAIFEVVPQINPRTKTILLVVSDGLLPIAADRGTLEKLRRKLQSSPNLQILFIIDDSDLAQQGLPDRHPIVEIASTLGAQLALSDLRSLLQASESELHSILQSPRVLSDLRLSIPSGCQLDDPLPETLVAGAYYAITGQCESKAHGSFRLSAMQEGRRIRGRIRTVKPTPLPAAFAVAESSALVERAATDGFSRPDWLSREMLHQSDLGFASSSRIQGVRRGRLDERIILHGLRNRLWPRAHACYNLALGRNPQQSGRVEFELAFGKGELSLVTVKDRGLHTADPQLLTCLEDAAWRVQFPAGVEDASVYRVHYPLQLKSPQQGQASQLSTDDELRYEWLIRRGPEADPELEQKRREQLGRIPRSPLDSPSLQRTQRSHETPIKRRDK